jgi:hypothetical protein
MPAMAPSSARQRGFGGNTFQTLSYIAGNFMTKIVFSGLLALLASSVLPAQAQGTSCTQWIDTLPVNIDAPGHYCLRNSVDTGLVGGAFNINASGVTLDCRGRSVRHVDAGNDAFGISAGGFGPVTDVTVRNCKLIGFATGIAFSPGSERVDIVNNDIVRARYDGISLWGRDSKIIGNRILEGRAATGLDYARNITVAAFQPGIPSTGNVISNNLVSGSADNGRIWGIRVDFSNGVVVHGNEIVGLRPNAGGFAVAIQVEGSDAQVSNNAMTGGAGTQFGIAGAPALCTRNIALGMTSAGFASCTRSVNDIEQP